NAFTLDVTEQLCRQRGCGVLHPPRAVCETRQLRDIAAAFAAKRSGRQKSGVELHSPFVRLTMNRDIERRLALVCRRDLPCGLRAKSFRPGLPEPSRRVEHLAVERGQKLL